MDNLPTEILLQIFQGFGVKDLVRCRGVNMRWRCIVDNIFSKESFWQHHCETDFADTYEIARRKCPPDFKWESLYRSLKLWGRISEAEEEIIEFCPPTCYTEDMKSARVVGVDEVAIHKRSGITYYVLDSFEQMQRKPITGNFIKYAENDTVIVLLSMQLQLLLLSKTDTFLVSSECTGHALVSTFNDIKDFIVSDDVVYMIHMNDGLHLCHFKTKGFRTESVGPLPDPIVSMGIKNNQLQMLLYNHKIYSLQKNNKFQYRTSLDNKSNLLEKLIEYKLVDTMDWQVFFQWMCEFKLYLQPDSILQDCVIMRIYGDVVFLGTNWGTFRIYYRPYYDGVFDLYRSQHVVEHNFIDHIMTYSLCPILAIDWQEIADGHKVIITVPKRIIVLKYQHF